MTNSMELRDTFNNKITYVRSICFADAGQHIKYVTLATLITMRTLKSQLLETFASLAAQSFPR